MNNNTSFDNMGRAMKNVRWPEIDSAPQVMERIRAAAGRPESRGRQRRVAYRKRLWIVTAVLLLFTAVSVSAAVSMSFSWNGIDISTYRPDEPVPGSSAAGDKPESDITRIEREMKARKEWKSFTLEEAGHLYKLPVLRPGSVSPAPSRTFGITRTGPFEKPLAADELHLDGFYDFYEQGEEWIVVVQKEAQPKEPTSMQIFYPEDWEVVKVDERILSASYGTDANRGMDVWMVVDETNERMLHLSGNVSKERLRKLAEAYVGKPLTP
ncbi:hypothetical protein [Paenibacillus ginsengarvi]|uniref:DUF4367 domain-containing protein n=1 Tax=Paenibacillus ginsengarvi TaxID=400777 RepID=A0A3B0BFY6_9BACL|nr:hypothetical protein [Paenibacillus ginsengarvi]RKN71228.1 hypothetical protein D7M11_29480 [Paenibacillus ginsengarvi]